RRRVACGHWLGDLRRPLAGRGVHAVPHTCGLPGHRPFLPTPRQPGRPPGERDEAGRRQRTERTGMTQHPGAPWRRLAGTVVCTGLMACASTTEPPEPPTLGLSDTTRFEAAPADAPDAQLADLRWWHRFDDPALAEWVERALAQSPDIAVARERAEQARVLLKQAGGQRGIQVDAEGSVESRSRREANQRSPDPSAAIL